MQPIRMQVPALEFYPRRPKLRRAPLVMAVVPDARWGSCLVCMGEAEEPNDGEIDLTMKEPFREALMNLVDRDGPVLCVDIRRVMFIDSAGLAVLVDVRKALLRVGRRLRVRVHPISQPCRVLLLGWFDTIMDVAKVDIGSDDTAE